jgi:hypothetical protein
LRTEGGIDYGRWKIKQQTIPCQAAECGKDIVHVDSDIEPGK